MNREHDQDPKGRARANWPRQRTQFEMRVDRPKALGRVAYVLIAAALLVAAALLASPAPGQTLPTGGQVVSGQATISQSGPAMTINQSSNRMIANWQSFSIGAGNSVTFNQPGASSVALNRVIGQDPSQILGSLNANGQVFLVNPNGIAIGKTGSVQTGGFVASTLGLSNENFLAGNYRFTGAGGGAITNDGSISGNVVALIAPTVSNGGTITGSTALAAGTDVLLDFNGDGLLSVEVKASTVKTLVENKGLIRADGGVAILTARGASAAMKGVVNNTGTVQAASIGRKNGRILLLGDMKYGEVNAGGTLRARSVETSAAKVNLAKDLKVDTQGGRWLIDPVDITIDANYAATLQAALSTGDVTVTTAGTGPDEGNITVNSSMVWGSHILTLRADNSIAINAPLTSTGTTSSDGLILQYAQTTATGTYSINAPVNLAAGSLFQTQNGSAAPITYSVITDLNALQNINANLTGNYVLGANIDASATATWNSGAGFTPIGGNGNTYSFFTGIFDGLGHSISNLTINQPSNDYVGLFGYINGATIRNVGLVGGSVTGANSVGGLVGASGLYTRPDTAYNTITNVYSTANVTASGLYVGGLVGISWLTTISNAHATGSVSGYRGAGGLVGLLYAGTIINSYATGDVSASLDSAGGLVAAASGALVGPTNYYWMATVDRSYATGNVTAGDRYVGGLMGRIIYGTISDSYATGNVSGLGDVGGLIGWNSISLLSRGYAAGAVSGSGNVGALIGRNDGNSTVAQSYANQETSGQSSACGANSGTSTVCGASLLTTAQMRDPFTFIANGFDFASVWGKSVSGANNGLPVLRGLGDTVYDAYVNVSGSAQTTYGTLASFGGLTVTGVNAGHVTLSWGSAVTTALGAGSYNLSGPDVLSTTSSGGAVYMGSVAVALTIDKAPLAITANSSKTYDGLAFSGGNVTYAGLMNGESASVLSGALSYGGSAQGAVNAGQYSLTASGLTSGNYDITYVDGALTINKAPLTITANGAGKTYDGLAFSGGNGVTYGGFVNGEGMAVLSGTLAYGGTAQGAVNAGQYSLTASGLASSNYDITYVAGALAISKAPLTITANNASKTYDGLLFSGGSGVTYAGLVNGEGASVLSGTFAYGGSAQGARNAGTYVITASGLSAQNYAITWVDGALTVDKAVISAITGITAANKVSDGTTAAVLNTSAARFSGMVAGDSLTVATASGSFADAFIGTNKVVSIAGLTLDGADAGNYTLSATTATATADIWTANAGGCSLLGAGGICGIVAPDPALELGRSDVVLIDMIPPAAGTSGTSGAITFGAASCPGGSGDGSQCRTSSTSH